LRDFVSRNSTSNCDNLIMLSNNVILFHLGSTSPRLLFNVLITFTFSNRYLEQLGRQCAGLLSAVTDLTSGCVPSDTRGFKNCRRHCDTYWGLEPLSVSTQAKGCASNPVCLERNVDFVLLELTCWVVRLLILQCCRRYFDVSILTANIRV
jgi:hypothetical protein